MISRVHKEMTSEDIAEIARTSHVGRGEDKDGKYSDAAGFYKSPTLGEIKANNYMLNPGDYVGVVEQEDDGELLE